jgi:CyaY protein
VKEVVRVPDHFAKIGRDRAELDVIDFAALGGVVDGLMDEALRDGPAQLFTKVREVRGQLFDEPTYAGFELFLPFVEPLIEIVVVVVVIVHGPCRGEFVSLWVIAALEIFLNARMGHNEQEARAERFFRPVIAVALSLPPLYLAVMNPRESEDSAFDKLGEQMLRRLDRALSDIDPDEAESYLGGDILNISLGDGTKIVINRHRAARQIWMAALRRAWHFDYDKDTSSWRTAGSDTEKSVELVSNLESVLTERLKRPIKLKLS